MCAAHVRSCSVCYIRVGEGNAKKKMSPLASPRYPFNEAVIIAVPDEPGVYSLYFGDDLIYIGAARGRPHAQTLKSQLIAHARGELEPAIATHFKWEVTHEPEKRLAEMLALLGRALPPYNRPDAR